MKAEYCITNGEQYIRQNHCGKFTQTNNITLAEMYQSKKAAYNVLKNSIPKRISESFYVARLQDGDLIQMSETSKSKENNIKYGLQQGFRYSNDADINYWYDKFVGIDELFAYADKRGGDIASKLSKLDMAVTDIEHYIEFNNLNARDGYKIYRKLHKILQQRRKLKSEQKIVNTINKNKDSASAIKQIVNTIKVESNHIYTPRIMQGLFSDGVDSLGKGDEYIEREDN